MWFPEKARVDPAERSSAATGNTTALLPAGLYSQNEAFLVGWHVAGIPRRVDTGSLRLQVEGHVQRSLALSLDDLRRRFEPVSVIAIAQRSGKSRSLFESRVPGGQWRHGAMGNALRTGVRLHDLLEAAGIRAGAIDVNSLRVVQRWRRGCPT